MTSRKHIIKDTSEIVKRNPIAIEIIIKHFFRGIKQLYKEYKPFKEYGLFVTYVKFNNKRKKKVK